MRELLEKNILPRDIIAYLFNEFVERTAFESRFSDSPDLSPCRFSEVETGFRSTDTRYVAMNHCSL